MQFANRRMFSEWKAWSLKPPSNFCAYNAYAHRINTHGILCSKGGQPCPGEWSFVARSVGSHWFPARRCAFQLEYPAVSDGENQTVWLNVHESFFRASMSLSLPPSILAASGKAWCMSLKRPKESNTCQAWVGVTRLFFCQVWSPSSRCRLGGEQCKWQGSGATATTTTKCSWATAFAAFVCRDSIALVTCHVEAQF